MDRSILEAAYDFVRASWPDAHPSLGLVLGSGWGEIADALGPREELAYEEIPGLGSPSVAGHSGLLSLARYAGTELFIFRGRRHWYEGAGWTPLAIPVYLMKRFGVSTVLLTNAAGGLRPDFEPGDLMIVTDHINMLGSNPLVGPHDNFWGPRFPDQSAVYDARLREQLTRSAEDVPVTLHHGVYLATTGPTYETPAEVVAFRALGADAVGMSTVPEAILANGAGLTVAAVSCITNPAAGISEDALSHDDVTAAAARAMPGMRALIERFIESL